jgi:DNA-binding response OmpR family regulator
MKILVVEDEKKIASFIRKGLEAQGFVVDLSHHGDEGFIAATTRPYDAIVLDIMLPGKDGLSILRNLRERKMAVPVILLTARSELNERLVGLNLGADDYLTKPFYIEELIARLPACRDAPGVGRKPEHPFRRRPYGEPAHPRGGARRAENRPDRARVRVVGTLREIPGPGAHAGADLRARVEL